MKAAKTPKNLEEMPYLPQKKFFFFFLKKRKTVLHKQRQMPQFHELLQNAWN